MHQGYYSFITTVCEHWPVRTMMAVFFRDKIIIAAVCESRVRIVMAICRDCYACSLTTAVSIVIMVFMAGGTFFQ